MILSEITERIVRKVFGGSASNEGIDYAYIESMVPKWRQGAIFIAYNGSRDRPGNQYLAPEWQQAFYVSIPASQRLTSNTNIYLSVTLPPLLRLNGKMDGLIFLGDESEMVNFRRIKSTSYAADLQRRGDLNKDSIGYVKVGNPVLLFGNKQLEGFTVNVILADPLEAPDFNIDQDDYPVSEDVIDIMEKLAMQELTTEFGQPEDQIVDGVDTKDRRINTVNAQ